MYEPIELSDSERRPPSERRRHQLRSLNRSIRTAVENTDLYSDLEVDRLDSLEEIRELPITTKSDLRDAGYRSTLVRSPADIREYHTSSGTTGEPTVLALTERDLRKSTDVLSHTWAMHGVGSGDTVQMMAAYGMFTAGLLNQYAIQSLGAGVVPSGVGSTTEQIRRIQRFEPNYLVAVSSYYLRLAHVFEERGEEIPDLDGLVGGGVPVTEKMRSYISSKFDAPFYNQYGLAEINTGIAGECRHQDGLHIQADYVYPEVVDPDTHEPLEEGEEGVLVLTPLQRDGQALLRYKTNDITSIRYDECECGRTLPRLSSIKGRTDDIIFVRGAKLDLNELQECMERLDDVVNPFNWQLRIDHESGRDVMYLTVERRDQVDEAYLRDQLREEIGLTVDHIEIDDAVVSDDAHKHRRLIDERSR